MGGGGETQEAEMSKQLPNHPQLKPSPDLSAAGSVHQESDSTATNEHARTNHQPFQILVCRESAIITTQHRQSIT